MTENDSDSVWKTRKTLLQKIKDNHDERSWEDFVFYYRDFIFNVIVKMNISHHDAEDITQRVLLKLWKTLPQFNYQPEKGRFRGWLCRITGNEVKDFFRARGRSPLVDLEDQEEQDSLTDQMANLPEIENIAKEEWRSYVSKLAWSNIVDGIDSKTAECFLMFARGKSIKEIVEKLGVAESTTYVYKKRVQDKLRNEIIRLNNELL
ncbi:MAG: sigma-70 family RNA polymerase sigma factor [Lentisphaeria bacterium]|nr:sigma-70 family RNA polymerase sigma factor [Lentisphaeria bacterium]